MSVFLSQPLMFMPGECIVSKKQHGRFRRVTVGLATSHVYARRMHSRLEKHKVGLRRLDSLPRFLGGGLGRGAAFTTPFPVPAERPQTGGECRRSGRTGRGGAAATPRWRRA